MRISVLTTAFLAISSIVQAADPSLLNLVMPDAQVVAGVNVFKAKTSPFGQFILRQMPESADFAKFVNASGFDPRRDLQEVLMAANTTTKDNGIVVARGTFDVAKIAALAVADGTHTVSQYRGAQIVAKTTPQGAAATVPAIAFFDSSLAVAGTVEAVKAAVDRRGSAAPINATLAAKVAAYSGADAWSVSLVPLSALGDGKAPAGGGGPFEGLFQGDLLKKVTQSSGSVTFASPVVISGELVSDTNQDATALGDVFKFLASMIQTNNPGAPVATLAQSLNLSTQGNTLKVGLTIPEAQLEALIQSGHKSSKQNKNPEKI